MIFLAAGLPDLPADAVGVLILLLISFFSWLKNRFGSKQETPPELELEEEDPMREVVWRRQLGEMLEPEPAPPPLPAEPVQAAAPASPPPLQTQVPDVSQREEELARAFEYQTRRKAGPASPHRRRLDSLLRSPHAARDAIVVREVLGPPLALRAARGE